MNYESRIKNRIIFLLFFVVLLTSCFIIHDSAPMAQAQTASSLKVTPIIIPVVLSPNQKVTQRIILENIGTGALPLRAVFSDFEQASEDGGYLLQEKNSNSLASWLSLSEKEFIIPSKGKKQITLTIQTPKTIPIGGYYSLIFFEPVLHTVTKTGATVSSRIGILVLGDIGITNPGAKKAEIIDFSLGGFIHQESQTSLLLRVKNISLHHLNAKPKLVITPLFGKSQIYALDEKYIFPGKVRRWDTILQLNTTTIGIYEAVIKVSLGKGEQEITKTFFLLFPVFQATIIVCTLLLLLLIWKKHRQVSNAIKILIKGR